MWFMRRLNIDVVFWFAQGTVEVLSTEGKVIMTKSGGDYFGELALLTVGGGPLGKSGHIAQTEAFSLKPKMMFCTTALT